MELIEDSVQHHCQENMMSGEAAWVMVRSSFLSQNYKNFQSKCDTLISVIRSVVLQATGFIIKYIRALIKS